MRTIRLDVQLPAEGDPRDRVTVILTTEPPLEEGKLPLGMLFLPLGWVKLLRTIEPVLAVVETDFALEWTGAPIAAVPDPRIGKLAKLLKKWINLFG